MKRLCATIAIFALSGGLALAQGGGGGGGGGGSSGGASSGGGAAGSSSSGNSAAQSASPSAGTTGSNAAAQQNGAGMSSTPGAAVNGPNNTGGPVPGLATPSAAPDLTTGRAPGVNPGNPQDASRRGNPSDRAVSGARDPEDMKAFGSGNDGVPQIIKPERR
jgi:hypothetical protein